jgi:hypothetical protein
MLESVIFLMQVLSVVVIVAGSVLVFSRVTRHDRAAEPRRFDFSTANDFEIDYRRVLAFARLRTRR